MSAARDSMQSVDQDCATARTVRAVGRHLPFSAVPLMPSPLLGVAMLMLGSIVTTSTVPGRDGPVLAALLTVASLLLEYLSLTWISPES